MKILIPQGQIKTRPALLALCLFLLPIIWPLALCIQLKTFNLGGTVIVLTYQLVLSQLLLLFSLHKEHTLIGTKPFTLASEIIAIILLMLGFFVLKQTPALLMLISYLLVHAGIFTRKMMKILNTILMTSVLSLFQHLLLMVNFNTTFSDLIPFYIGLFFLIFSYIMMQSEREGFEWEHKYNKFEIVVFMLLTAVFAIIQRNQWPLLLISFLLGLACCVIIPKKESEI